MHNHTHLYYARVKILYSDFTITNHVKLHIIQHNLGVLWYCPCDLVAKTFTIYVSCWKTWYIVGLAGANMKWGCLLLSTEREHCICLVLWSIWGLTQPSKLQVKVIHVRHNLRKMFITLFGMSYNFSFYLHHFHIIVLPILFCV